MSSPPPTQPSTSRPWARTGRRLGRALLGLVAAVVGVITLEPFRFTWPDGVQLAWWDTPLGVAANVALFVPLGFLAALTPTAAGAGESTGWWRLLRIGALAALASASIEAVQLFEPARYPSAIDVASNTLGALLGAGMHARLARRLGADTPLLGGLALELPLMGLVYVAMPLATLAAATLADAPAPAPGAVASMAAPRTLALLALAGFVGSLLGSVQRQRLGPEGTLGRRGVVLAAAGWTALAGIPALALHPLAYAAAMAVGAATAWRVAGGEPFGVERRFEQEALGRAGPWLAGYLLLLPLGDPAGALAAGAEPPPLLILRHVEWGAAFAVLGYFLAEAWGRRELRFRAAGWRVALVAAAAAGVLAGLAAGVETHGTGLGTGTLRVLAAAYGGWIYHLQRDHVRTLLAAARATAGDGDGQQGPATRRAA
jgi:VanZ family protein